ncbi:hypothetical protein DBT_0775 [Dissulfuribacter thermophilus]|uniref:Uncharacterized protein n=1 Tax=Dissulfuribacter thermophilus TaxID=1156395 RepID=A0A1B9F7H9_9BACT|nr:hypothetical protein [Dissulfuribacter thermophilus]OCC15850.1 hypothetical protein DBT_0775 [Dissulfuribacter thermophilus]
MLPLISCRSYWKSHYRYLKRRLEDLGGHILSPLILKHPSKEPWKTMGGFLTIAGKNPKRIPLLKTKFTQYGHSREQLIEVKEALKRILGQEI